MRLGVIGGGVVGQATARAFQEHVDGVMIYDTRPARATHGLHVTLGADLVFVCLPEGELAGFFAGLNPAPVNFVIKSTVPVGTTKALQERHPGFSFVHSPEFLTGRCAHSDAQVPARNIIGDPGRGGSIMSRCAWLLMGFLEQRFPGIPVLGMSSDESEFVKLATNTLFAVKVGAFNELHAFAKRHLLDWDRVLAGIMSDGRIAHAHNKVPGPDGQFGFGGCLDKDLRMLVEQMDQPWLAKDGSDEYEMPWITSAALSRNRRDREREVK